MMSAARRRTVSLVIVVVFSYLAYLSFSYSLNNDGYVHLLKERFVDNLAGADGTFVGFQGKVVSVERDIYSVFDNISVVYVLLEYQSYSCSGSGDDRHCSWSTHYYTQDTTPFAMSVNGVNVRIDPAENITFVPKNYAVFNQTRDRRILQRVIERDAPVYGWGLLENSGLRAYDDVDHGKRILLITDDARRLLSDAINGVLWLQILAGVIIFIMAVVLFIVTTDWSERLFPVQAPRTPQRKGGVDKTEKL